MQKDWYADTFISRARRFSEDFVYWFDTVGRSLPFGRSLTYRFAQVCLWRNFILSGAYKGTDYTLGMIKGIISRNFEFWENQPVIKGKEGSLSIGYGYANLLLSEDYNAPGSPMWAFKSFAILELPDSHEFWNCREEPYSVVTEKTIQRHGGFQGVVSAEGRHYVFLSSSQYSASRLSREEIDTVQMYESYAVSQWKTGPARICSYLIPVSNDVHVRIHELFCQVPVDLCEGGFPLPVWNRKFAEPELTRHGSILSNPYGISQILDLLGNRKPEVVQQGTNTNIYSCEPNGVPVLQRTLELGNHTLACAVCGTPGRVENMDARMTGISLIQTDSGWTLEWSGRRIEIERIRATGF